MPVRGLSCYTASLHGYLAHEWDAARIVAGSVRLALRVDLPGGELAFSHHQPSLQLLPDGTCLRYAAASYPAAALPAVAGELRKHGRAIVVADAAKLPWSAIRGGQSTPHWLLIDAADGGRWHIVDDFTALLTAGWQSPHRAWLSSAQLSDAMTLPTRWRPEQQARNAFAFGSPVPVPHGSALWLARCARAVTAGSKDQRWLDTDDRLLPFVASYLTEHGAAAERYLDDIWAAAGHRSFAYRWQLGQGPSLRRRQALELAIDRWDKLPQLLRIAVGRAQRGRPRPVLVHMAIEELLSAERELS
jgi:hypothetical protein